MSNIPLTLRLVKGNKLTFSELDQNFINLRNSIIYTANTIGNTIQFYTIGGGIINSGSNGVKVYKALLTQTGTNVPVATVLENSLGGAIVWSRDSQGFYIGSLVGAFPNELKVFSLLGMQKNDNDVLFQQGWNDADSIYIATYKVDGGTVLADSLLINTSILIEVYP